MAMRSKCSFVPRMLPALFLLLACGLPLVASAQGAPGAPGAPGPGGGASPGLAYRSNPASPDEPHARAPGPTCPAITPYSVGGGRNLFAFGDFTDLAGFEGFRCAVDWYLGSGVANGGQTWTRFEPKGVVTRWELAMNLYRFFAIMDESGCDLDDVGDIATQPFLPSVQNLCGAGIYGRLEGRRFHPYDRVQVQELLAWVFRAANSPQAALRAGTHVEAGTAADLAAFPDAAQVDPENLAAVAGMVKAGYYTPSGRELAPRADLRRIDLVNLLHAFANARAPKTMNADAEARIHAVERVDGGSRRIDGQALEAAGVNTSAIYARNGAQVQVTRSTINTRSALQAPTEGVSPMGAMLAYRWGLDGGIVAAGAGTLVTVADSTAGSTGQGAYVLYALLGGTIRVRDSTLARDDYTLFVANNGNIELDHVKIRGQGRSYSSDLGGGTITYRHVDSEKHGGGGGGGVMNDEWTTGAFYDSTLKGDSYLSQSTGVARVYMQDTNVETATGVEFRNNTSMPTDTASWEVHGGSLTFTNRCHHADGARMDNHQCQPWVVSATHGQRFIARFDGVKFRLAPGIGLLHLEEGASARLYFSHVSVGGDLVAEEGSSAEVYLDHATLTGKVRGDVRIVRVK